MNSNVSITNIIFKNIIIKQTIIGIYSNKNINEETVQFISIQNMIILNTNFVNSSFLLIDNINNAFLFFDTLYFNSLDGGGRLIFIRFS